MKTIMKRQDFRVLFVSKTGRVNAPYLDPSVRYRCFNPAEILLGIGVQSDVVAQNFLNVAFIDNYDAFVFHRPDPQDEKLPLFIELAKAKGKKVVADYDDLIFNPSYALNSSIFRNGLATEEQIIDIFNRNYKGLCYFDHYTVSTEPLAEQIKLLRPNASVKIIPNGLSRKLLSCFSYADRMLERRLSNKKKIISYLSGTATHMPDFASIADVIKEILEKHSDVRFTIAGPMQLPDSIKRHPGIVRQPYRQFMEFFSATGIFYANIAPLAEDNAFNNCKSGLKFFESGIWNVPTIATPIADFRRFSDSNGLILPQSQEEWMNAFEEIIDLERYRIRIKGLREYCLKNCMADAHANKLLTFLQKGE